jgi:serine/threonine protein phosphatase 1
MSSLLDPSEKPLFGRLRRWLLGPQRLRESQRRAFQGRPVIVAEPETAPEPEPVKVRERPSQAPEGVCIYAIGDIHGRADLLDTLLARIEEDCATLPPGTQVKLVFLGDYIDRGLKSKAVIELLSSTRFDRANTVFLLGNHEQALLNFLQDPSFGTQWSRFGGNETLFSYGFQPPNLRRSLHSNDAMASVRDDWNRLWHEFRANFPPHHLAFLQSLKTRHIEGDYIFVHAGLRPGVGVDDQVLQDMLWIREEFLSDPAEFPLMVVHGHTPEDAPFLDHRRVGVDTGAFLSGKLTAARFFGTEIAFLNT